MQRVRLRAQCLAPDVFNMAQSLVLVRTHERARSHIRMYSNMQLPSGCRYSRPAHKNGCCSVAAQCRPTYLPVGGGWRPARPHPASLLLHLAPLQSSIAAAECKRAAQFAETFRRACTVNGWQASNRTGMPLNPWTRTMVRLPTSTLLTST